MTDPKVVDKLKNTLAVVLDFVDYTAGNCRPNEMVGAVLPQTIIKQAREVLASPPVAQKMTRDEALKHVVSDILHQNDD